MVTAGGACYQQLTGVLPATSGVESPLGGYGAIVTLYLGGLVISLVAVALARDRGRTTVQ
ncbi:MAG: hypothetical protein HY329_16170 [Chloroflexi bacterium]|nr:hypothetical protein [Chloroflexota bacterium]